MAYREGKWKVDEVANGWVLSFYVKSKRKVQQVDKQGRPTHVEELTDWNEREEVYTDASVLAKRLVSLMKEAKQ
jgi:hypothetical protein